MRAFWKRTLTFIGNWLQRVGVSAQNTFRYAKWK